MMLDAHNPMNGYSWEQLLSTGTLVMIRLSGIMVFAPPLNSAAIPPRIKAALVLAMTILVVPTMPSPHELSIAAILGEIAASLIFGFSLTLLNEALLFAGSIMGMSFSFSLANLMDPNSRVETPVIGTILSWLGTLILLGAGLHRLLIASVIRSFAIVPPGTATMKMVSVHTAVEMVAGIFLAGLQLAAPVLAATITVEIAMALIGRMAPALPVQIVSIPVKTLLSYTVLIGSLAIWPHWIEAHFTRLLDAAQTMVAA